VDINRAALEVLQRELDLVYQAGMENTPKQESIMSLSMQTASAARSQVHVWLERVPGFKEWVEGSGRKFEDIVSRTFEVINVEYEDSVRIHKNHLADSTAGEIGSIYSPVVSMMAQAWIELKLNLIMNVLIDNQTTYSGDALFANTHAGTDTYSGTMDNLVTDALSATSFEAAFTSAAAWKYRNGENVEAQWTHLVVGPKLRTTAWNIVKNTKAPAAGDSTDVTVDNPNFNRVELVVSNKINATAGVDNDVDAADFWYLLDLSRPLKPVCLQIREEAATLMDTDPVILKRTGLVDYMSNGRLAASPTLAHLAYAGQAT